MTIAPSQPNGDYFHFDKPVKSVAVIGAGPSGLPAARHLSESGLLVRLFERQSKPGGIWSWSEDIPLPSSIPTPPPSVGDFTPKLPPKSTTVPFVNTRSDWDGKERKEFAPPNPVYWSLSNNVPTPLMQFKDFPWPEGTDWYLPHSAFAAYQQAYADHFNLHRLASYNTRVEHVKKLQTEGKWRLTLRKLEPLADGQLEETFWSEDFDALVVATGHYGAPFIPQIEGADEWVRRWPRRVIHSRAYRKPETYEGKTVLLIGSGTSGVDIAKDLSTHAKKVYQVARDKILGPESYVKFRTIQRTFLPSNAELVREVTKFTLPPKGGNINEGGVELTDGTVIKGIDAVIFSTGYQYSFPFLSEFQDALDPSQVLVTNGAGVHNLYQDFAYIPDPTLNFIGLSINTATYSFFEFQSIAISRVLTGRARLPGLETRKKEYLDLLEERGGVKFAHFMGSDKEREYVKRTVAWLNTEAEVFGAPRVEGHSNRHIAVVDKMGEGFVKKLKGMEEANRWAREVFSASIGSDGRESAETDQDQKPTLHKAEIFNTPIAQVA